MCIRVSFFGGEWGTFFAGRLVFRVLITSFSAVFKSNDRKARVYGGVELMSAV